MTNRRDVIKGGMAATTAFFGGGSALAATGSGQGRAAAPGEPVHAISEIIYDNRFQPAEAFAAAAQRRGLTPHAITGDVTWLWYHRLDAAWKTGPQAIAGMTGEGALFVLERLAWEKGMAVAFRARHTPNARGGIDHRFEGPGSHIARAAELDAGWAGSMVDLVSRCPVKTGGKAVLSTSTAGGGDWPGGEPLVSWIIAPTGRTAFPRT